MSNKTIRVVVTSGGKAIGHIGVEIKSMLGDLIEWTDQNGQVFFSDWIYEYPLYLEVWVNDPDEMVNTNPEYSSKYLSTTLKATADETHSIFCILEKAGEESPEPTPTPTPTPKPPTPTTYYYSIIVTDELGNRIKDVSVSNEDTRISYPTKTNIYGEFKTTSTQDTINFSFTKKGFLYQVHWFMGKNYDSDIPETIVLSPESEAGTPEPETPLEPLGQTPAPSTLPVESGPVDRKYYFFIRIKDSEGKDISGVVVKDRDGETFPDVSNDIGLWQGESTKQNIRFSLIKAGYQTLNSNTYETGTTIMPLSYISIYTMRKSDEEIVTVTPPPDMIINFHDLDGTNISNLKVYIEGTAYTTNNAGNIMVKKKT